MILQVDAGNTRVKWRTLINGEASSVQHMSMVEFIAELEVLLVDVQQVQISGVADMSDLLQALSAIVAQDKLYVAQTLKQQAGLINRYDDYQKLGVDRWLAMLAASQKYSQGFIVVDAGTALTIDVVSQGQHLGGYILPGVRTAQMSLVVGTAQIQLDDNVGAQLGLGQSTAECISHGVLRQLSVLIADVANDYPSLPVLLSGGDLDKFKGLFPLAEICPDIVFDGLAYSAELAATQ